ncbi:MAG: CehA/McbA family metallohydrolase [Bellilinea sp.]
MHEFVVNLHTHTRYSDGAGTHAQIAQAALEAGLDCVIITDHNVHVRGFEGYSRKEGRKLLVLVGEEVHDQARQPQKNHLLVLGIDREMALDADQPQYLIDRVAQAGGLSFIAHPVESDLPLFHEEDISWEDWQVRNYTGIELWNGLSEIKNLIHTWFDAIIFGLNPELVARNPHPAAIQRWDSLLADGRQVVVIGGSDAHALLKRVGPFKIIIFPYKFHFQAINTHVLTPEPLSWHNLQKDSKLIYQALQNGHCFIGYDLPASTRGFRFTCQTRRGVLSMGDQAVIDGAVTLQVRLPLPAECRLICDGKVIKVWQDQQIGAYITKEPGVYRVESYIRYLGKLRGWIFSNPIYLRSTGSESSLNTGQQWSQTTLPAF